MTTNISEILSRLAARRRPVRVIATGGGTGGHTYPAITTLRATRSLLTEADLDLDVLYVGSATGLEARVATAEGLPFRAISTGKLRRASNPLKMISGDNLRDVGRVVRGLAEAGPIVREFRPGVVLSTGGYVAVPIGVAASRAHCPLLIHEQTTKLGLANRLLVRRANRVALSSPASLPLLPESVRSRAVVTGNPIRPELATGDRETALKALNWQGWDPTLPTVYVTGGAQGAVQINTLVDGVLPRLLDHANVIHQCGAGSIDAVQARARQLPDPLAGRYRVVAFVGAELPDVYALADVVIARSGAGTLAELTALGKPSVLVPLMSSANGEQEHNARHLAEAGAASALIGDQATTDALWHHLASLLAAPDQRTAMAQAARQLGHPDAARNLATLLLDLASQ